MMNNKIKCFNSVRKLTYTWLTDLHTLVCRTFSGSAEIGYCEIDWKSCNDDLSEKQAKIVEAYRSADLILVKKLQYELIQSFSARALAVRKVTSNSVKNISGVDT